MKAATRKRLASKEDDYWLVDLGPAGNSGANTYAFPTKRAATIFAMNHRGRSAVVRNPYGRVVGEYVQDAS